MPKQVCCNLLLQVYWQDFQLQFIFLVVRSRLARKPPNIANPKPWFERYQSDFKKKRNWNKGKEKVWGKAMDERCEWVKQSFAELWEVEIYHSSETKSEEVSRTVRHEKLIATIPWYTNTRLALFVLSVKVS